jgi:prophage antirepressor-like protein
MNNEIQIFNYNDHEVRTVQKDGEPWFVLKDVCGILSIGNVADVYARLDTDEKGVGQIDTLGGRQNMSIINESGLYNVILRSDKPEAKPFRKWVTSEVLLSMVEMHNSGAVILYIMPQNIFLTFLRSGNIIELSEHRNAR